MTTKWNAKGVLIGACSCDWGCPCSFDAPPTKGWCQGGYVWHFTEGRFGDVPLAGLSMSWLAHSPAALHKGNVTGLTLIDEKANPAQRAALTKLSQGESGGPNCLGERRRPEANDRAKPRRARETDYGGCEASR